MQTTAVCSAAEVAHEFSQKIQQIVARDKAGKSERSAHPVRSEDVRAGLEAGRRHASDIANAVNARQGYVKEASALAI